MLTTPNYPDSDPMQCTNEENPGTTAKFIAKKKWKNIIIIMAVCTVFVGVVFLLLFNEFGKENSMEEIGAVLFNDQGFENLSSVPGYPFTFDAPDDLPFFWSIRVNHYGFDVKKHHASGGHSDAYIGNDLIINDGETIYWTMYGNDGRQDPPTAGKRIFLEAILYSDQIVSEKDSVTKKYIMGYCVIEIFIDDPCGKYRAQMLNSAYYPQRNGKYQDITAEYIQEQIEKAKK